MSDLPIFTRTADENIAQLEAEVVSLEQCVADFQAENARLREALEEIGDHDCEDIYSNKASCGKCRTCLANNALEEAGDG